MKDPYNFRLTNAVYGLIVSIFTVWTVYQLVLAGSILLAIGASVFIAAILLVMMTDHTKPMIDMDMKRENGTNMFPLDKDWDSSNPTVQRWITGKPNPHARKRTPGEPPVW